MTDWFRSWHGAPTDPKWVLIGRKASISPALASGIAWALFDHASQATPRGCVSGFDCEVYAAWGGIDDTQVFACVQAMKDRGMIGEDGMLAAWARRQPSREDGSAERAKDWRERKKYEQTQIERNRTQPNAIDQQIQSREDTERKNIGIDKSIPLVQSKNNFEIHELKKIGVDENLVNDWKAVRRAKRAGPITKTVIDALIRESQIAGIPPPDAVKICIERGWQGFNAKWLDGSKNERNNGFKPKQSTGDAIHASMARVLAQSGLDGLSPIDTGGKIIDH